MSGIQQADLDSEIEEYYMVSGGELGDEEFDTDEIVLELFEVVISNTVQDLCEESVKTGKPLTSMRHNCIKFLENLYVIPENVETEELEVYINATIERNNNISDYIHQLRKISSDNPVLHEIINIKQKVLKKLKKAEDEMIKRQLLSINLLL